MNNEIDMIDSKLQSDIDFFRDPNTIVLITSEKKDNTYIFYNTLTKEYRESSFSKNMFLMVYGKKDIEDKLEKPCPCIVRNIPYTLSSGRILQEENTHNIIFNKYHSPSTIFSLNKDAKLPEEYRNFFEHLFPVSEQREYAYDWIAFSLRGKNRTFLTLCGIEGVGKGIFSTVISELHLKENSVTIDNPHFQSRFNSGLFGKTLTILDEPNLRGDDSMDKLKLYANDTIRREDKGKDAIDFPIYFNLIISTNREDAIAIGESSRRFSFIDLTETTIKNIPYSPSLIHKICNTNKVNQKNIEELFSFFWFREIKSDLLDTLKSNMTDIVLKASNPEYIIEAVEYIESRKSKTITQDELYSFLQKQAIRNNWKQLPSRKYIRDTIKSKFSNSIKVVNSQNLFSFRYIKGE